MGDKDPAAGCIRLPLARAQPGERAAAASLPSHGARELDGVAAVAGAAGSVDAGAFHDCGRSVR